MKIFPKGLIIKPKRETAPDFVKAHLSVKVDEFTAFLKEHQDNGWVNIDILKSKEGKTYLALNTFKKEMDIPVIEDGEQNW
jgi:hypothetical protein